MKNLLKKACELLEIKYDYLKNLSKLRVKELRKITQVQNLNEGGGVNNLKELMKLNHHSTSNLPLKGPIKDCLKANEHIVVCEIDSADLWIKFKLHMESANRHLDSEIELKVEKNIKGHLFY
jgi:hypothetical protein